MTHRDLYRPPARSAAGAGGLSATTGAPRAGMTPAKVLPFRRRAVKPARRRRSLLLALVRPFVTALVIVALPTGAGLWLVTSPSFRVAAIDVRGAERVPAAWVEARLSPALGESLLLLSLERAAAELAEHPWIAAFELAKELPDRLVVRLEERRPAAVVERDGTLYCVDGEGRLILPLTEVGGLTGKLLRVDGERGEAASIPRALAVRRELEQAHPAWGSALERVEVLGGGDFRLHTTELPFPLVVRSGQLEARLERLEALLPRIRDGFGELEAVDLRFARRIIIQPAVSEPRGT